MTEAKAQSPHSFRLILRYGLDPFNGLEENLKRLEQFAKESTLDEVMFLLAPEERSSGHPTVEQSRPWMEAMLRAKAMLAGQGIGVSINPWTTTYHSGRGRRLHEGQEFGLMVGETGINNGMTACPLSENWQEYLVDYFVWIAKELNPLALWVEDDWRLHNHGGEMGYGGCFCESCLERFSRQIGQAVTREEVVARVAQPGQPDPMRAKWLEFARRSLAEPAEVLASALKEARPEMRIGFMTSIPDIHSIEGRDWNQLMQIWSGGKDRYLIRPHMPPYTEEPPIVTTPGYSRQTLANLDQSADIYPELENSPRCGQYSGSHAYSAWEIFNAVFYGSRGITINHFDNMGMNTFYDRGFGAALGRHRPVLEQLMSLKLDDRHALGVNILFSPDVAASKWTGEPTGSRAKMYTGEDLTRFDSGAASLNDLQANSIEWSKVFYALGISHGFTRGNSETEGEVVAVSDQTLRCYDDDTLLKLLSGKVILDLPSVEILVQRGLGHLIGVRDCSRVKLGETAYSLEEIRPEFFGELEGGVKARMCAQRCADPIGKIDYDEGARILSDIKTADLKTLFPATALYENELGGRVFSHVYPLATGQFYMAYFNVVRQAFWTKVLFVMGGAESKQVIAEEHPLHVHAVNLEHGFFVAATNVIYDKTESFSLRMAEGMLADHRPQVLKASGEWEPLEPVKEVEEGIVRLHFKMKLDPLESAMVLFR